MDHLRRFAANPQRSTPTDPTRQALDDIVRESLAILLPASLTCTWVWAAYVVLFIPTLTGAAYASLLAASLSALAAHQLASRFLQAAVAVYLGGLFVAVTVVVIAAGPSTVTLYIPFVVVAAMLTNPWTTALLAFVCAAAAALLGRQAGQPLEAALLPGLLIGLTALTALVSSRRLYTALSWALNMTGQARRNAQEAQNNRAELRRVLQTLDIAYDRLERTNRALIFAQESAEKAYRFKSEFVANVSHELRTPLNLIVGFSEMMATAPESYGGVPLPRAYRGDMMATYRNACHLLELINDVLDLSQLEAGQLPLTRQRSDLCEIVREAAGMVQGLADARGLELQIALPDEPLPLWLDRTRIRQVLLNLLTNAMRYTERGFVRVEVTIGGESSAPPHAPPSVALAAAPGQVTVSVTDSGRGIDPANLHRAFEAFSRLDEAQIRDGSGLGLAISKKFIELHDGRISIESELGQGTSVRFCLPLPDLRREPRPTSRLSSRLDDRQSPHVLVLHDDVRTLSILRRHITDCEFHLASDPAAARAMLQELPDVVVQDQDWTRAARQEQAAAAPLVLPGHVPLITCPLPSMRHFGVLLGADDYLPKPVTREDLAAALARLERPPKTALIVDDDPHVVRLLGRMLRTLDAALHLYEAFSGESAVEIARSQQPDVIFLDMNMPHMGGKAVIDALSADRAAAGFAPGSASGRIPIIVVSVRSIEEENSPLPGDVSIRRPDGFTLSELLPLLNALLANLTRPDVVSPASAAARLPKSPG